MLVMFFLGHAEIYEPSWNESLLCLIVAFVISERLVWQVIQQYRELKGQHKKGDM